MTIAQFEAPGDEASDCTIDNHIRLKCGHAFHSDCILSSFRYNPQCPCCRGGAITQSRNIVIEFVDTTLDSEEQEEQDVMNKLHTIRRSDPEVMAARKQLKIKKQEFKAYCTTIQEKKKRMMQELTKELRKEKAMHTKLFTKARNEIKNVQRVELRVAAEKYGETTAMEIQEMMQVFYEPVLALRNPTTRKCFWFR
jgi:hypothetical protein